MPRMLWKFAVMCLAAMLAYNTYLFVQVDSFRPLFAVSYVLWLGIAAMCVWNRPTRKSAHSLNRFNRHLYVEQRIANRTCMWRQEMDASGLTEEQQLLIAVRMKV